MFTQSDTLTHFCERIVSCAAVKGVSGNESRVGSSLLFCAIAAICLGEPPRTLRVRGELPLVQLVKMTPSTALSLQLAFLIEPSVQEIRYGFLIAPLFGYWGIIISCTVDDSPPGISPTCSKDGTMAASNAAGTIGSSTKPMPRRHHNGRSAVVMPAGTAY